MPAVTYPAPVGGWNARDSISDMPPTDAVKLINFRPRPGRVEVRGGQTQLASALPGFSFNAGDLGAVTTLRSTFGDILIFTIQDYMYAYDGTSVTTVITGAGVSGGVFWDSAHFQNKLIMTVGDGTNVAQVIDYDGLTVSNTALNITTGPNEEDIRGVQVHKGRAYYWETASQSFWYAAAGAYQGELTEFPLDTAIKSGGALQMMLTLTVDGGGGQDDLACFIFSSGEVLVYQGDDPGDAAAWELVGSFEIGQPVDPQAHAKIAGTELVFTRDGVVDIAEALKLGRFGDSAEFTNKITNAASQAAKDYVANSGWQIVHSPADNCLLLNIPEGDDGVGGITYAQYVRETDTGGWWECNNWNGRFTVFNDRLHLLVALESRYYIVRCLDESGTDDSNYGTNINAQAIPAFTTVSKSPQRKRLTAVKPFTNVGNGGNGINVAGLADFDTTFPSITKDVDSVGTRTSPNITVSANGVYLTYALQLSVGSGDAGVKWDATTIFYEEGGPV